MSSPQSVSVGQAAANVLSAWLASALPPDIIISPQWPEADVPLPPKAISVIRRGRRTRTDATNGIWVASRTNLSPTTASVAFTIGGVVQPMQLDVWATNDADRDDMLAQLDTVLYVGAGITLGAPVTDDPIRDGLLLALNPEDGYEGFVDFWFDDADIEDSPASIQLGEYRATLLGEARLAYSVVATTPRMVSTTLKTKLVEGAGSAPAPGQLYDTVTLTPNPNPPPAVKVTPGQSS